MSNLEEWKWLYTMPEGQSLERKGCYDYSGASPKPLSFKDLARKVAETVVAMANADGGVVAIGIEDNGRVTGIPEGYDIADLRTRLNQLITPSLGISLQEVLLENTRIWVLEVDWSTEVHQLSDGRYLYRRNDQNLPFSAESIAAIKQNRLTRFYEQQIVQEASLSDIDPNLVLSLAEKAGLPSSVEQTLLHYRLAVGQNGRVRLRMGALLLFGKDPVAWHPRCGIDFAVWKGTTRQTGERFNIVKRIHIEAPLLQVIREAHETIQRYIPERQVLVDLFFNERLVFPQFAWQEAIVNAVAHRDYSLTGVGIEVDLFDDRLEVRSPGLLVPPVTLEQLRSGKRVHASRNPYIVRVLTDYGYMRDRGEGIPRMHRVMEEEGLKPPEFNIEGGCFVVTLYNSPIYSPETMRWLKQFDSMGLSRNQKRLLAFAYERDGRFTSRDYQQLTGLDKYTASRDIHDLVRRGVVRLERPRGREYLINLPAEPPPPAEPEELRQLKPLLEEQGYIKNEDIRKALRVSVDKATQIARRLVQGGWLEAKGEKRGRRYYLKKN